MKTFLSSHPNFLKYFLGEGICPLNIYFITFEVLFLMKEVLKFPEYFFKRSGQVG
jgi:hypothetical protein